MTIMAGRSNKVILAITILFVIGIIAAIIIPAILNVNLSTLWHYNYVQDLRGNTYETIDYMIMEDYPHSEENYLYDVPYGWGLHVQSNESREDAFKRFAEDYQTLVPIGTKIKIEQVNFVRGIFGVTSDSLEVILSSPCLDDGRLLKTTIVLVSYELCRENYSIEKCIFLRRVKSLTPIPDERTIEMSPIKISDESSFVNSC